MSSNRRSFFLRVGGLIAVCTFLVTASFIGILALLSGEIVDPQARIPWYLVVGALTFVSTIVLLEENGTSGRDILATAVLSTALVFTLVALGVEGILFALERPEGVFDSQLILNLFAAGLISTGIGYWGLKHWREFSTGGGGQL